MNWFEKNCKQYSDNSYRYSNNPRVAFFYMVPEKLKFCNKEVTWDSERLEILEDNREYGWEEWMFEPIL